jgi:probable HAF family extracellular repeat protein
VTHRPALVIAALAAAAPSADAQTTFTRLGTVNTQAAAVTPDGSAVAGTVRIGRVQSGFVWTPGGGLSLLPLLPTADTAGAAGISADGSVIVGTSGDAQSGAFKAVRWTAADGALDLGDLPGGDVFSHCTGVSASGQIVVGDSASHEGPLGQEAFLWTPAAGMVGLGYPSGGSSFGYATSADGSVVAGTLTDSDLVFQAYRWTQAGGMIPLGFLPTGGVESQGVGLSADGSAAVGWNNALDADFNLSQQAFRWTAATGMVGLGFLPDSGDTFSQAFAVSGDGAIVVGTATDANFTQVATIWDAADGLRSLQDVLVAAGLAAQLDGWILIEADAISPNGQYIVGQAMNPAGSFESWIVHLAPPCRPDFNGDGQVNIADFLAFLGAFAGGDGRCDFTADGQVNVQDFLAFLSAYAAGC